MPEVVQNLLLIYALAVLINTLVSFALWWVKRDRVTRGQLFIWTASLIAIVAQGSLVNGIVQVALGATSVFLVTTAITNLLTTIGETRARWGLYLAVLAGGWVVAAGAIYTGQPFMAITAPVLVGVVFPIWSAAIELIVKRWRDLTFSGRGMVIASLIYGAHILDFAVLGDKPEFILLGFSIGVITIFLLSVFVPAVVVEILTASHARTAAEIEAARRIQMDLLPRKPEIPGLELSCYMKPTDEVGGDYYDIQNHGDRSWIMLGDVTGHGLSSGLVMLMAQSIISSILHTQKDVSPAQLNILTNEILFKNLCRLNEDRTMTIVSICVTEQRKLSICGWHDDMYIHRQATGEVEVVPIAQFPFGLGFVDNVEPDFVTETSHELAPGDTVFVITDGVTEAALGGDYKRGMFEEERLLAFIKQHAGRPLDEIRDSLATALDEFTGGVFHDDVTFLIARLKESADS